MTKMEAARILDPETRVEALAEIEYYHGFNGEAAKTDALIEACRIAASLLRAQQEQRKNEPLTLEELRGMAGEPMWAVRTDGGDMLREKKAVPCVLDYTVGFGAMRPAVIAIYGRNLSLGESDYGKTWLAYRHKPVEVAK